MDSLRDTVSEPIKVDRSGGCGLHPERYDDDLEKSKLTRRRLGSPIAVVDSETSRVTGTLGSSQDHEISGCWGG